MNYWKSTRAVPTTARNLIVAALCLVIVAGSIFTLPFSTGGFVKAARTNLPLLPKSAAAELQGPRSPLKSLQPPSSGTWWGAYVPGAPGDHQALAGFEAKAGRKPAIVSFYLNWAGAPDFPAASVNWLGKQGILPLLVWESWDPSSGQGATQPMFSLQRITDGSFDNYLTLFAAEVRAYGGPIFLSPFHEMNGDWYPWGGAVNGNSAELYVQAWRHVHDIFWAAGASNVTWVWAVNQSSAPVTAANQPASYYPGDAYVDWVGLDAYNWGGAARSGRWNSVAATFDHNLTLLAGYHKPLIITETGSAEQGGDKAAWISDLFRSLTTRYRSQVRAVIWFNKNFNDADWRIESSVPTIRSFRTGVEASGIVSAPNMRGMFP